MRSVLDPRTRKSAAGRLSAVLLVGATISVGCSSASKASPSSSGVAPSSTTAAVGVVAKPSRGFDGTTVTVAGLGGLANFAGADVGAEARFKRANDTNELNGIRIKYVEFADDQANPATALSEARRLVSQDNVFAIVPDFSAVNPAAYLTSAQVPWIGWGFDNSYCSDTPSTSIWGFGWAGCETPTAPLTVPDGDAEFYAYVAKKVGKPQPSLVMFSSDTQAGIDTTRTGAVAAAGAGFKVLSAKGNVPPVVSDYSPYVQQWMTADAGKPPDAMFCLETVQCVSEWAAVKAAGFTGTFYATLGPVGALAKGLAGTITSTGYNTSASPAFTQMAADLQAFKAGTAPVSYSNVPAYFAADMFIQALKKVGRDITPQSVQHALATQTWSLPGLVGPTVYPASTVGPSPSCTEMLLDDGTNWNVVEPYTCSSKTFPVK